MNRLRENNVEKCATVLREFINGSAMPEREKGIAILALRQLKTIRAGNGGDTLLSHNPRCIQTPLAG